MENNKNSGDGLNVYLPEGYKGEPVNINLRHGETEKVFQRSTKVAILGTIYAPLIFAMGLHTRLTDKKAVSIESAPGRDASALSELPGLVTYNYGLRGKTNPFIKLDEQPLHPIDGEIVTGTLEWNTDWDSWQINEPAEFGSKKLEHLLKKHAGMFEDISVVRDLIKQLQTVSVKFETEVERADDRQGNKEARLKEAINIAKGEIPKEINLVAPLFYGTPDVKIRLEIELDRSGNNVVYSFYCPEFEPAKTATVKAIIDEQVANLKGWYTAIEQA